MKRLIFLFCVLFGSTFAQGPVQCLYSGVWTPCSLIANVQLAQAVNTQVSGGTGTSITSAFAGNTTGGNTIVVIAFESAAAIPVITDAQSNTYAVVASSATAPGYTISVAQNIVGGTTDTITSTYTSGTGAFAAYELKGGAYVGQAWDLFNGQQGTGSTITFAQQTSASPGEFMIAGVGLPSGTVNAKPALGGNNTSLVTVDQNNSVVTGTGSALQVAYSAHTNLSDARTFTQTISLSGSLVYSGVIASIRPSKLPVTIANPFSTPGNVAILPAAGFTTYAASKLGLATAASATDIAVLSGNATNTVIPIFVSLSCTQTTGGIQQVQLEIRTTADTGGTSTGSPTAYPLDQNNAAALSSVLTYTANPTINDGSNRIIDAQTVGMLTTTTAVPNDIYIWRPGVGQSVVLRGTAQQLALNLNGVTITGSSCAVTYRWLEVPNY